MFDLPRTDDPLQLEQIFTEVQNLLDECYQQTTGSVNGQISILICLVLETKWYKCEDNILGPKSLREIGNFCNILDQQCLRKFIDEHSYLIHIRHKQIKDKHVLGYYVPHWLCDFVFDPNQS